MKHPDLQYNFYFPFYSQKRSGQKKYFYMVETILHLSDNEEISLRLKYKRNKISEVNVSKLTSDKTLSDAKYNRTLIHYTAFTEEVNATFRYISTAIKMLSSSKSYRKNFVFNTYFKHNDSIEMELEYNKIHVSFDNFDYVIENGKKKKDESTESGDELLKNIGTYLSAIESQITYTEIEDTVFNEKLDYIWEGFIEYFKCPKVIKKTKYVPQ